MCNYLLPALLQSGPGACIGSSQQPEAGNWKAVKEPCYQPFPAGDYCSSYFIAFGPAYHAGDGGVCIS